jgi:HEAT repeats
MHLISALASRLPHPASSFAFFAPRFTLHASRPSLYALILLACVGCSKEKSTAELIVDLKSPQDREKISAVRLLPGHTGDAAKVIPALIEALKDKDGDVRRSSAIGLGNFGEEAKDAIPALQLAQHDHDARVRESAGVALTRIDPVKFPASAKGKSKSK